MAIEMDKCEGCPFLGVDTGSSYHDDIQACGYFHRTCKTVKDCHLTNRDKIIIEAMICGDEVTHEVIEFEKGLGPYRSGRKARRHIVEWYEFVQPRKPEREGDGDVRS